MPWCPDLVSRPSAKAQEPLARSRGQWQEVDGLLFNPKNSQLVHILSFHSQGVVFLFIFPKQRTMGGPRHGARVWCLGRVPKHRNQWQEVGGLLFSPQNSLLVHILRFHSQAVVSLFIIPTGPTALDSEPRRRRYVKNMIYNRNCLYSRAIHCPASMEMHYVQ